MSKMDLDSELAVGRTSIYVNSASRGSGTATNFRMSLTPTMNARKYRVKKASIPFTYYTVRTGINDVFALATAADGNISITLPAGSYTPTTLKPMMQNLLNPLVTGNVTVTFNATTLRVELAFTATTGEINAASLAAGTANSFLGFGAIQAPANPMIGSSVYNLSGPEELFIHSQALQDSSALSSYSTADFQLKTTSVIHRVSVNVNFGSTIIDDYGTSSWQDYPNRSITQLDFSLRYADGTLVDLQGREWSLELEVIGKDC